MVAFSEPWSSASLLHHQPCRPYNEFGAIGTCLCLPKSGFTKPSSCQSWQCLWDLDSTHRRHKRLEAFHMKCQCQIAKIHWQDHVRNTHVSSLQTGLGPVLDPIVRRRSSLFGHVARLPENTSAHQAWWCHIVCVTWSPSRPELEAMSRPPSGQVAWPTPQGQQYTSCRLLETSRHACTLGGDATVIDDCALTTTTMTMSTSRVLTSQLTSHRRTFLKSVDPNEKHNNKKNNNKMSSDMGSLSSWSKNTLNDKDQQTRETGAPRRQISAGSACVDVIL